jgi:hypothetical protein
MALKREFEFTVKFRKTMYGIKDISEAIERVKTDIEMDLLSPDEKLIEVKIKELK